MKLGFVRFNVRYHPAWKISKLIILLASFYKISRASRQMK